MTRRLKSAKVNGVRVYLQAYQTKPTNREGNPQDVVVFYYIVKATDGSYRKIMQYEDALFQISATHRVREASNAN